MSDVHCSNMGIISAT